MILILRVTYSVCRIGWKNGVLMMQYTDRLRACRKGIRQAIGTNNAILGIEPLQEIEARRFLLRVLREPESEKLRTHIRTEAGAIILKVSYGYTIEPRGTDPLIDLVEEAMGQFSEAACPGKWLVDVIPSCEPLKSGLRVAVNLVHSEIPPGMASRYGVQRDR